MKPKRFRKRLLSRILGVVHGSQHAKRNAKHPRRMSLDDQAPIYGFVIVHAVHSVARRPGCFYQVVETTWTRMTKILRSHELPEINRNFAGTPLYAVNLNSLKSTLLALKG
jgi:hypothetical protein